ncbi:hypothetical protein GGR55DRAFT_677633 [Xylaria sp. FL0064]|nr:hypothetical protein GGR55DRAFT_677633 [Xylaria sp. FL0064]
MVSHGNLTSGPGPYFSEYGRSLYAQPADLTLWRQCVSQHARKERAERINGPLKRTEGDFTYDLSLEFRGIMIPFTPGLEKYAWTDLALVETSEDEKENSRADPEQSSLVLSTFHAPTPLQNSLLNSSCLPAPRSHLIPRPLPSGVEDGHDVTAPSQRFEQIPGVKRSRNHGDHGGYYRDDEEGEESEIENQRPTKFRKLSAEDTEEEFSNSSASESDREYDGTMVFCGLNHAGIKDATNYSITGIIIIIIKESNAARSARTSSIYPRSSAATSNISLAAHPAANKSGYDYEQPLLPPLRAPEARPRPLLSPMEPRYYYPALPADFVLPGDPFDGYLSLASLRSSSRPLTPSEREAAKYYLEVTAAQALRASG